MNNMHTGSWLIDPRARNLVNALYESPEHRIFRADSRSGAPQNSIAFVEIPVAAKPHIFT